MLRFIISVTIRMLISKWFPFGIQSGGGGGVRGLRFTPRRLLYCRVNTSEYLGVTYYHFYIRFIGQTTYFL